MEGGHQPRARICAVEPALGEGGVGNKYAGLRGGLHPPNEDGESGERTSRSMPVLAPGFVSRLQPPINTTHNPSSSPLRRDSSAEPSPLHVRIFSNEHAIVDSLRGGAKEIETNNGNVPRKLRKLSSQNIVYVERIEFSNLECN